MTWPPQQTRAGVVLLSVLPSEPASVDAPSAWCLGAPRSGLLVGYVTASDTVVAAAVVAMAEEFDTAAAQAGTEAAR
jgi:hypothetical protein